MAKKKICSNCGYQGKPKTKVKGSILIEIVLWLCFIIPGLIYSLYRSTSAARYKICPECGAPNMIPITSPMGKKILSSQHTTM